MNKKLILPNLIIAGVPKAGTTSLFTYLNAHPEISGSIVKETCYFLPLRFEQDIQSLSEYTKFFKVYGEPKYILESTPGYFYGNRIIPQIIKDNLQNVKIILIFREPLSRLISFYNHMKNVLKINKYVTFKEYLELCLKYNENYFANKHFKEREEDVKYRGIIDGFYSLFIDEWINTFNNNLKIIFFEEFVKNPYSVMLDICRWLDINKKFYTDYKFAIDNRSIMYKNKQLHFFGIFINKRLEFFWRQYPTLKRFFREVYYKINDSSMSSKLRISDLDRKITTEIQTIFRPYNEAFYNKLQKMGFQKVPWDL